MAANILPVYIDKIEEGLTRFLVDKKAKYPAFQDTKFSLEECGCIDSMLVLFYLEFRRFPDNSELENLLANRPETKNFRKTLRSAQSRRREFQKNIEVILGIDDSVLDEFQGNVPEDVHSSQDLVDWILGEKYPHLLFEIRQ